RREHPEHLGCERARRCAGPKQETHRRVDLAGKAMQGEGEEREESLPRVRHGKAILARGPAIARSDESTRSNTPQQQASRLDLPVPRHRRNMAPMNAAQPATRAAGTSSSGSYP